MKNYHFIFTEIWDDKGKHCLKEIYFWTFKLDQKEILIKQSTIIDEK